MVRSVIFFVFLSLVLEGQELRLDSLIEASPFVPEGFGRPQLETRREVAEIDEIEEAFEIRGVVEIGGKVVYSVRNRKDGRSVWTEAGSDMGGFFPEIVSYDPNERAAVVRLGDQMATLEISETAWRSEPQFEDSQKEQRELGGNREVRRVERQPSIEQRRDNPVRRVLRPPEPTDASTGVRGKHFNPSRSENFQAAVLPAPPVAPRPFSGSRQPSEETDDTETRAPETPTESVGEEDGVALNEEEVVLEAPQEGPPPAPATQPPREIPQLPPGFDLEAFLRERAERNQQSPD